MKQIEKKSIYPRRVALPKPREANAAADAALHSEIGHEQVMRLMLMRRRALAYELDLLDAVIDRFKILSICGQPDFQDVERYKEKNGVTRKFVDDHQAPVAQLQWLDHLENEFNHPGEDPGNVSGLRWGTGALLANNLFLTAGHCFGAYGGFAVPTRNNGVPISTPEIATHMRVNFNYQVDATGNPRAEVQFPVLQLVEYSYIVDYAIVRLGANTANQLPNQLFSWLTPAAKDVTTKGTILCIIQHPSQGMKKVDVGPMLGNNGIVMSYNTIDTNDGSSGAPILDPMGTIAGVHNSGDCATSANFAVPIGAIRAVSTIIH